MTESGPYARIFVSPAPGGPLALWYRVESTRDGHRVTFGGDLDENASFGDLLAELGKIGGRVAFELSEVRRINSCGVREWVNLGRKLAELPIDVVYEACSPALVGQLNTISNFRGLARVESFLAPYVCEACGREEHHLVEVVGDGRPGDRLSARLPTPRCSHCDAVLVFDDLPERYLSFLRDL